MTSIHKLLVLGGGYQDPKRARTVRCMTWFFFSCEPRSSEDTIYWVIEDRGLFHGERHEHSSQGMIDARGSVSR